MGSPRCFFTRRIRVSIVCASPTAYGIIGTVCVNSTGFFARLLLEISVVATTAQEGALQVAGAHPLAILSEVPAKRYVKK